MDDTAPSHSTAVSIRPLGENELDNADQIFRTAFGTFLGLPDPAAFMSGAELVRARWHTDPAAFLAAEFDGTLVGSSYATNRGSFGFFGPVTVMPGLWDRGIGQRLVEATLELFGRWGTRHVALFTFPHSAKHIALYQKFGFWPRHLTAVMRKRVALTARDERLSLLSGLAEDERRQCLDSCSELSDAVYPGLDLRLEMKAVLAQRTGDILLLHERSRLDAFALVHCGPGSEAESGSCYVKFAACRPGQRADAAFARLISACERFAATRSLAWLVAGVNTARDVAYRAMLAAGYKPEILGVVMHRPNEPAYDREDVFVADDWR